MNEVKIGITQNITPVITETLVETISQIQTAPLPLNNALCGIPHFTAKMLNLTKVLIQKLVLTLRSSLD